MSTDFCRHNARKYHQVVLPNNHPRLGVSGASRTAHAAAHLSTSARKQRKTVLEPYLDQLLKPFTPAPTESKALRARASSFKRLQLLPILQRLLSQGIMITLMPLLFNVLREEQSKETGCLGLRPWSVQH